MLRRSLAAPALLLPLYLAGCGSDALPQGEHGPDLDALPVLEVRELLRIGSLDDPDYGFSFVRGVDVDEEGNLYVMEAQDQEIRVYDPDGELVHRFGGRGEGPGEFTGLERFGVMGDTVWAFDTGLRRLTLFTQGGEVLSSSVVEEVFASFRSPRERAVLWPGRPDGDGLFLAETGPVALDFGLPQERETVQVPLVRFGPDGQVVDTVGFVPRWWGFQTDVVSVGRSTYTIPNPPWAGSRWTHTPRDVLTIDQGRPGELHRLRIVRTRHSGDTVRVRDFSYRPHPFPPELMDSLAVVQAHRVGSFGRVGPAGFEQHERHAQDSAAARTAIRRAMDWPEVQPPVRAEFVTSEGALWLMREQLRAGTRRWTLLDPEDEPEGELRLPSGAQIMWSDGPEFWTMERDEFEIPWLVKYRIEGVG
jgi:hypothetical protein